MTEIGLFIYPWDLADEGIDRVFDFAASSGCTTVHMASVYHAGLFLQPHNPQHKVYLLEDGVAYFHPQLDLYGEIRPQRAHIARETDWFAAASARVREFGLALSAWTVCMHNSRLGENHPNAIIEDAFGNPRPYALCPSNPAVRHYVRALVEDLTRYPLTALLLEAFRYMDVVHGAHHERWSIPLAPLERTLLGLSFTASDLAAARQAGVDGERVRALVSAHLQAYFAAYPTIAPELPRNLNVFDERYPEVSAYRACLESVMDALFDEVRQSIVGRNVKLIGQGEQDFNISCSPGKEGFDALLRAVYDQTPEQAAATVQQAKRSTLPGQQIYVGIKLGFGAMTNDKQLRSTVIAVEDAGADGVLLYNYAECPQTVLNWIGPAVKSARRARTS
jgi:hypothetical protein